MVGLNSECRVLSCVTLRGVNTRKPGGKKKNRKNGGGKGGRKERKTE